VGLGLLTRYPLEKALNARLQIFAFRVSAEFYLIHVAKRRAGYGHPCFFALLFL
jgi:hypothetical protein